MSIRITIIEQSRGLNPSRWDWRIENIDGRGAEVISEGRGETFAQTIQLIDTSAKRLIDALTPFKEEESVIVIDRGEERNATVVGYGKAGIFVKFDDAPEIGSWAYSRSDLRRK